MTPGGRCTSHHKKGSISSHRAGGWTAPNIMTDHPPVDKLGWFRTGHSSQRTLAAWNIERAVVAGWDAWPGYHLGSSSSQQHQWCGSIFPSVSRCPWASHPLSSDEASTFGKDHFYPTGCCACNDSEVEFLSFQWWQIRIFLMATPFRN